LFDLIDATIRREYHIDPETLEEDKLLDLYAAYRILRKNELKDTEITMQNALIEVFNKILPSDG
jgi:hypothetical protein